MLFIHTVNVVQWGVCACVWRGGSKDSVIKRQDLQQWKRKTKIDGSFFFFQTKLAVVGGSSVLWCYANNVCECEISPDKGGEQSRAERGDGGARRQRRGVFLVRNWTTRETLVGVDSEARKGFLLGWTRGSVSASPLVCQSVKVSSPSLTPLLSLSSSTHHSRPSPLFTPSHSHLHTSTSSRHFPSSSLRRIPGLPTARPRSLQRVSAQRDRERESEWGREGVCMCVVVGKCVWARERESVCVCVCECVCVCAHPPATGPSVLFLPLSRLVVRSWRWKRSATGPGLCRSSTSCCCHTRPCTMRSARFRTLTRPSSPWRYGAPFSSSTPFHRGGFLSRLPADPACPPPCAFLFVCRLFCAPTAARMCCHMLAAVGLYFCFGCTCSSTHQLPTLPPLLPTPPPKNPHHS